MTLNQNNNLTRALRLATGAVGGYFVTRGFIAMSGVVLTLLGLARSEAMTLSLLLGFCLFPAIIIWAAATRHVLVFSLSLVAVAAALTYFAPILVATP